MSQHYSKNSQRYSILRSNLFKLAKEKIAVLHTRLSAFVKTLCLNLLKRNKNEYIQQRRAIEQVKLLRHHFQAALHFLQKVHLKKQGLHSSLYQLPWYLMIGMPSSGKTTLLTHAEIKFAGTEQFVFTSPEVSQYCNWWFAKNGVIIDVPGYYLQPSSDKEPGEILWKQLLKQLKIHRPSQPINGIILTFNLYDLLLKSSEEQKETLLFIKQRLYVLSKKIRKKIPLYIVLTKVDTLAGFKEFFSDLTGNDRRQLWGMTFSDEKKISLSTLHALFDQAFSTFVERLNSRLLLRLQQERDITKRGIIKDFPLQVESLKKPLYRLLHQLTETAESHQKFGIVGLYFSSSVQSDITIDRLWQSLNTTFPLQTYPSVITHKKTRPYFIKSLFDNVILQPRTTTKQPKKFSLPAVGGIISILSVTLFYFALAFKQNIALINASDVALREYKALSQQLTNPMLTKPYLIKVLQSLTALNKASTLLEKAHDAKTLKVELPHERELKEKVEASYNHLLKMVLLPELRKVLEEKLLDNTLTNPDQLYPTLTAYLMLGDPLRFDPLFINNWLKTFAQQTLLSDPLIQQQIQKHLSRALTLSSKEELNQQAIMSARQRLNAIPSILLAYAILKTSENNGLNQFLLITSAKNQTDNTMVFQQTNSSVIPLFYTAKYFNEIYFKGISQACQIALQGNWVLGSSLSNTSNDIHQLIAELRNRYVIDYANYWQSTLQSLRLAHFVTLDQAIFALEKLTTTTSPLLNVVNNLSANTDVNYLIAAKSPDILTPIKLILDPSFQSFWPLNGNSDQLSLINQIIFELNNLKHTLQTIKSANDRGKAAFDLAKTRTRDMVDDPFNMLRDLAKQTPEPLRNWLNQIANDTWRLVVYQAQAYIDTMWQTTVMPEYKAKLYNRYPLFSEASEEIALSDFTHFFAPSGTLNTFFITYLKPFVDLNQAHWQWRQIDGQTLAIPIHILDQFERAAVIQRLFFATNKSRLLVPFTLQLSSLPVSIKAVKIMISGQSHIDQREKNTPSYFVWPSDQEQEAALLFNNIHNETIVIKETGPWALFKLLSRANIAPQSNLTHFTLTFDLHGETVNYQLFATQVMNPFIPGIINHFRCPEKL